ncbi:ABC transporter permease [Phytoactinopolyspora mesophila]|uniref:ABC transporter permease subunit n=1 Tax=Phytoactinopolyspora mesophila TaxID=2650750 RepID=A0A7K3M7W7_9ACTN|nr:ABC transporter permease [Phytoactinopolyspora mesophila]NDL59375.1 ABC transporter permease subunit [Phytoactinopolyspora mesophila]
MKLARGTGGWRSGATLAIAGLCLVIAVALAVPPLWPHSAIATDFTATMQPPSLAHPMGTDGVGRDMLARFAAGARISLLIGLVAVVAGALAGAVIGVVAGLSRGLIDNILMRAMDALMAFPALMLAMAVTIGFGRGLQSATVGVTLGVVPWVARMARGETLRIVALPMIEAARALGLRRLQLVRRHVVPHMISLLMIQATSAYGAVILAVAALGFLGLGAQVPTPEWGAIITEGLEPALTGAWWVALFPGLGMLLVVTCTNVLSDRLRDVLDPRGSFATVRSR